MKGKWCLGRKNSICTVTPLVRSQVRILSHPCLIPKDFAHIPLTWTLGKGTGQKGRSWCWVVTSLLWGRLCPQRWWSYELERKAGQTCSQVAWMFCKALHSATVIFDLSCQAPSWAVTDWEGTCNVSRPQLLLCLTTVLRRTLLISEMAWLFPHLSCGLSVLLKHEEMSPWWGPIR